MFYMLPYYIRIRNRGHVLFDKLYASLIYGEIISLTLESFFELGIAGWLNMSH